MSTVSSSTTYTMTFSGDTTYLYEMIYFEIVIPDGATNLSYHIDGSWSYTGSANPTNIDLAGEVIVNNTSFSFDTTKVYHSKDGRYYCNCACWVKNKKGAVVTFDLTLTATYNMQSTEPIITIGTPTKNKISRVEGYDQSVVTFTSDMDLQAWEARATLPGVTPERGVGLLVESGTTLSANTEATIYIDDEELTNGDNTYTITVYGQSTGGEWSE